MKQVLILLSFGFFFFAPPSSAATLGTAGVKVSLISLRDSGEVLIQTTPKHLVSGLGCSNNFWLVLDSSLPTFKTTYAMLLLARITKAQVIVVADDKISGAFCHLSRFVLMAD